MEPATSGTDVQPQEPTVSHGGAVARAAAGTAAAKAARVNCPVMVVEDDAASRNALIMLLKHLGFETWYATNVAEAMQMLSRGPTAVILDLMLPDGNGASVLEHVRHEGLATRVAVATGAGDWKTLLDETRLKPDAVFLKPIDFPKLVRWLDEACGAAAN